jgi:hypothetical protein
VPQVPQSHAAFDGTHNHPGPEQAVTGALQSRPPSADRWDRITATVLSLLFDLTQQAARFSSGSTPWGQLAVYDAEAFAPFTRDGAA